MITLHIGDDFVKPVTLLNNDPAVPYDVSQASSIKAAMSTSDSSRLYCGPVDCDSAADGADWATGLVVVDFPSSETLKIAEHVKAFGFARLEIQVTIDSRKYTWSATLEVRNGVIN